MGGKCQLTCNYTCGYCRINNYFLDDLISGHGSVISALLWLAVPRDIYRCEGTMGHAIGYTTRFIREEMHWWRYISPAARAWRSAGLVSRSRKCPRRSWGAHGLLRSSPRLLARASTHGMTPHPFLRDPANGSVTTVGHDCTLELAAAPSPRAHIKQPPPSASHTFRIPPHIFLSRDKLA